MPVDDVWNTPLPSRVSRVRALSSTLVFVLVSACSKLWIGWLNRPSVHGKDRLMAAIDKRPVGKPLVTVSNHQSLLDDPLLAYMLSWRQVLDRSALRWLLGAKSVCFRSYHSSLFFQLGKVLPVVRGEGVHQRAMDFCVDRLGEGHWVHLFPEGKVNVTKEFMRIKWGVGRLVADSVVSPLVLPYWHLGMDDVLPNKKPYKPQTGKVVTVVIGEPIDFERDIKRLKAENRTDVEIRKYITDKIQESFADLKTETEEKHAQGVEMATQPLSNEDLN